MTKSRRQKLEHQMDLDVRRHARRITREDTRGVWCRRQTCDRMIPEWRRTGFGQMDDQARSSEYHCGSVCRGKDMECRAVLTGRQSERPEVARLLGGSVVVSAAPAGKFDEVASQAKSISLRYDFDAMKFDPGGRPAGFRFPTKQESDAARERLYGGTRLVRVEVADEPDEPAETEQVVVDPKWPTKSSWCAQRNRRCDLIGFGVAMATASLVFWLVGR